MIPWQIVGLGLTLVACRPEPEIITTDTGSDAETGSPDSGDTGPLDTSEPAETGSVDTGDTVDSTGGLGSIEGDCGVLNAERLTDESTELWQNVLDLDDGFDAEQASAGGVEIWEAGNLGGSSLESEVVAFEVLHHCEGAELLQTESEIPYVDDGGKKTDMLVTVDDVSVGVSVTRAYHYPPEEGYTEEEASDLLEGKLGDILQSAANAQDPWARSLLHVIAYDEDHAQSVQLAYQELDGSLTQSTLVFLTITDGQDSEVY
ncbi:MAG: hypothetical protein QGG40_07865 [Myxococcota bacterium]|jgi:hypothetical protein|nr:hypothetical protein [Myxococcota bacterium]